jgi:TPR repeat protein
LLPRAERRVRHARVAEFFEESTAELGEAAAALARHWREAGEPERAVVYFIRAAEQAERGWAKDQAAIIYREALDLIPADDTERLGDIRRRLALARAAAVHIPDARQLMQET